MPDDDEPIEIPEDPQELIAQLCGVIVAWNVVAAVMVPIVAASQPRLGELLTDMVNQDVPPLAKIAQSSPRVAKVMHETIDELRQQLDDAMRPH